MAQNSPEASDAGRGGKADVIPSLLTGEVTDMQGSWVGGPSPGGQGSLRKIPRAASGNGKREYVTDMTGDRTGQETQARKEGGRTLECGTGLCIDPVGCISHTFQLLFRSHSLDWDYHPTFMERTDPEKYKVK